MQEDTVSALRETFLDFFSTIEDPRIERCKLHPISEILVLTLAAVISGAEGWIDIERYGHLKLDFLRRFFPYENGIPSDDTLRRFFRRVDPKTFQKRFVEWVQCLSSKEEETLISIDGKYCLTSDSVKHGFTWELRVSVAIRSQFVLVAGRGANGMCVVDQVEVSHFVAFWLEGEQIHHLEGDERSVPDCPVVLKIRGCMVLLRLAQEDVDWRDHVLRRRTGQAVEEWAG